MTLAANNSPFEMHTKTFPKGQPLPQPRHLPQSSPSEIIEDIRNRELGLLSDWRLKANAATLERHRGIHTVSVMAARNANQIGDKEASDQLLAFEKGVQENTKLAKLAKGTSRPATSSANQQLMENTLNKLFTKSAGRRMSDADTELEDADSTVLRGVSSHVLQGIREGKRGKDLVDHTNSFSHPWPTNFGLSPLEHYIE